MLLEEWMDHNKITAVDMAKKLGVSRIAFDRYKEGNVPKSWILAAKLENLTIGAVTLQELVNERKLVDYKLKKKLAKEEKNAKKNGKEHKKEKNEVV